LIEPSPFKSSGYGNNGNKATEGYFQFNKTTSATNSNEVNSVKENGLEVEGLLSSPVGPGATNEDLGHDPFNTEITCMEYTVSPIALVLPTQVECPSTGSAK
jgi:hypothetical protein